ncbi:MAG: cation transporter [Chitinophagaceae bacterium]|nr:cation transporter [Chitinophagaceae bacterium]
MGHEHHHHSTQNIRLAFLVNTLFAIVELAGGLLTNSMAILSDALHDFGDSLSLGLAWYLQQKSARPGNATYTYGYKRFSLLAALINAVVLAVGSVFVIAEAVERISHPQQPDARGMLLLAILGLVFNGFAMLRLRRGNSISERVVSLHFLEDVLGWVAVLLGALVMMVYDIPILDPLLSLAIACFILFNVYRNLKPALKIVLQGIPDAAQEAAIRATILSCDKVSEIHDFRMWSLDGEHSVISLHAVVTEEMSLKQAEHLKEKIKADLLQHEVVHATIEIEYAPEHG